jgi:heterokaryon incompatibility protein (HET)
MDKIAKRLGDWKDPGYQKLKGCCDIARQDGYLYVWTDTCCIDRRNSLELSKTISSMLRIFKAAAVCYVYLGDFVMGENHDIYSWERNRWFTRCWTLQELIAPKQVRFYDKNWEQIGTKYSLSLVIEHITRINPKVLNGSKSPRDCTAAEILSWTYVGESRAKEDEAYSLLGLFNIEMPLHYGEADIAFLRLRAEILSQLGDFSALLDVKQISNEPHKFSTHHLRS